MGEPFFKRQVLVADEAAFGEFIADPGSATWEKNLPVLDVTLEPIQTRMEDMSAQARLAVQALGHKGVRRGRIRFRTYWMGHITDPTGALTETWQQQLLGDGLGGNKVDVAGTTIASATGADGFTLNAAGNWAAGVVGRMGSKYDTRGEGHAFVVGSMAGAVVTALVAAAAQPNANDVVRPCQLAYHVEGAALTTKRFMLLHATTGAQVMLFGAQLAGLSLRSPVGGSCEIEWVYEGCYFEREQVAFPSALALQSHDCGPFTGGAFTLQDFGTAARTTITPAEVAIDIQLGLEPVVGPGGAGIYQDVVGWTRTGCRAQIELKVPWTPDLETWWDTENPSLVYKHLLAEFHPGHGRSFGAYFPRVFPMGPRPTDVQRVNEQNYVRVVLGATESTLTTNDLTRSAFRLWSS